MMVDQRVARGRRQPGGSPLSLLVNFNETIEHNPKQPTDRSINDWSYLDRRKPEPTQL